MVNSRVPFTFSESDLCKLLEDPHSCVCLKKCKRHIAIDPSLLGDVPLAIRECLNSLVTKFDFELDGIVLGYRKMKLLGGDGGILNDAAHIHVDIKAQFFVFKPEVGCTLTGIVKEKSPDHIGCLVHTVFNVSIPHLNAVKEERPINIGQQVTFKVDEVDLSNTLPYIKGTLISVGKIQTHSGSSGFMGEFLTGKKKESDVEKYLLQKKKKISISHEREEDGLEDATAAEDLVDSNLPLTFPTSILKKRDSSVITSPSKRISFDDLMSEESDKGNKKTKLKTFPLLISQGDALKINEAKEQLSSPEKQKKKTVRKDREVCGNEDEETEISKKTKDKTECDKEGNLINLEVIKNIKRENIEKEGNEAVAPKRKKKRLRNLEETYLDMTQEELDVETKHKEKNKHISLTPVKRHSKKKLKGAEDHEENEDDCEAGKRMNVCGSGSSLEDVTRSSKKKKKKEKKDSNETFNSPEANSTVIPDFSLRFPKGVNADLFGVLSPIVKTGTDSSDEEKGLVTSTQKDKVPGKKSQVQKSPSPADLLEKFIKEKNAASKGSTPAAAKTKAKAEIQRMKSPKVPSTDLLKKAVLSGHSKQLLKTNAPKSSSDGDTSSSEPPDEPSFQSFKEKLEKERRVASNSDSSSSEPSDLSSVKQMKEKAMKKILKSKSQRSVSNLRPADSASNSSDDEAALHDKLQRGKVKKREKNIQVNSRSESKSSGKTSGKVRRKQSDSKKKKDERKRKTTKFNSSLNNSVLSEKESAGTGSPKKKHKTDSKTERKSNQKKKKSKSVDKTTEKTAALDVDSAKLTALAESLLKKLTG